MPGRKSKISPTFSCKARIVTAVTASSRRCCLPAGAQMMSTGCCRPTLEIIGAGSASPRSLAKRCVSAVADIASTRRSGRRFLRASRQSASPISVGRFLSWTSSKMTKPTPGSSGSFCKRRVRIPSVTTSMRVLGPIWRSSRVWYPTSSPGSCPINEAKRRAAARAASRRGSSITMRCPFNQLSLIRRNGTRVVLPAPGGATKTAVRRVANAARSSVTTSSIGRSVVGNRISQVRVCR